MSSSLLLKFFPFSLVFFNLIMMQLGVVLSVSLYLGFFELLGSVDVLFSSNLEKNLPSFPRIVFLISNPSETSMTCMLINLKLSCYSLRPFPLVIFLIMLQFRSFFFFFCCVFKFTDTFSSVISYVYPI